MSWRTQYEAADPNKQQNKTEPFYDSDAWYQLRYRVLKRYAGCCQCCGARASSGVSFHVDHIKPRSKYPELELDIDNLQVLCRACNKGKGNWDETDWRPEIPLWRRYR